MFLGARVDDALSTYHRRQLEHGDTLTLDQLHDAYRDHWTRELAAERGKRGVLWDAELDEPRAFTIGLDAVTLALTELVPRLGQVVAVQRELTFTLAPGLDWTIQGYLDLETLQPSPDGGEPVATIVDYKVKTTLHSQARADHDPQAGLYLAGRWLTGNPAQHFCFAQIGRPGGRRKTMATALSLPAAPPGSCAPRSPGSRRPPARSPPCTTATGPTNRGGSPTPAAGNARRATAPTTPAAPAAADCEPAAAAGDRPARLADRAAS